MDYSKPITFEQWYPTVKGPFTMLSKRYKPILGRDGLPMIVVILTNNNKTISTQVSQTEWPLIEAASETIRFVDDKTGMEIFGRYFVSEKVREVEKELIALVNSLVTAAMMKPTVH